MSGRAGSLSGGKSTKITEGRVRVSASDVANFLACQQLTQLDLRAARRIRRSADASLRPADRQSYLMWCR
jgi:hypothetical protein